MMGEPVRWSDEADEVIKGDITAATAYLTPAGGAVVTAVGHAGYRPSRSGRDWVHYLTGFPQEAGADHHRPARDAGLSLA